MYSIVLNSRHLDYFREESEKERKLSSTVSSVTSLDFLIEQRKLCELKMMQCGWLSCLHSALITLMVWCFKWLISPVSPRCTARPCSLPATFRVRGILRSTNYYDLLHFTRTRTTSCSFSTAKHNSKEPLEQRIITSWLTNVLNMLYYWKQFWNASKSRNTYVMQHFLYAFSQQYETRWLLYGICLSLRVRITEWNIFVLQCH